MFPWEKIDWAAVGTGAVMVAVLLFQGVKGFLSGRDEKPVLSPGGTHPGNSVEVAGALIDTKRIDLLIAEIGALSAVLITLRKIVEENGSRLDHNSKVALGVAEHAERLAREMRDLRDETKDLRDEMLRGTRNR